MSASYGDDLQTARQRIPLPTVTIDAVAPVAADPGRNFNEVHTVQTLTVGLRKIANTLHAVEVPPASRSGEADASADPAWIVTTA